WKGAWDDSTAAITADPKCGQAFRVRALLRYFAVIPWDGAKVRDKVRQAALKANVWTDALDSLAFRLTLVSDAKAACDAFPDRPDPILWYIRAEAGFDLGHVFVTDAKMTRPLLVAG